MSIHTEIVKARDGEATIVTRIVAGASKENLLPPHEDIAVGGEVNAIGVILRDGLVKWGKCLETSPVFDILGKMGAPATGAEEEVDVIDDLAGPEGDNGRVGLGHVQSLHGAAYGGLSEVQALDGDVDAPLVVLALRRRGGCMRCVIDGLTAREHLAGCQKRRDRHGARRRFRRGRWDGGWGGCARLLMGVRQAAFRASRLLLLCGGWLFSLLAASPLCRSVAAVHIGTALSLSRCFCVIL